MQKNSTPSTTAPQPSSQSLTPSKKSISFIRQFARIYMPVNRMPGVVLN